MKIYPGINSDADPDATPRSGAGPGAGAALSPEDGFSRGERLGAFLRLHRQRLSPQAAGLPAGGRRRTPGLRREELAHLCEVSPTWITWLEQGRGVAASAGVLARLAQALQLSPAERAYLFDLAERRDPQEPEPLPRPAHAALRGVEAMRCPAYVLDRRWDVAAANPQAVELFLGWGAGAGETPNLLRFLFLSPAARALIHDWETRAWRLVAEFRADCGRQADSPVIRPLIAELSAASADFARLWRTHDVLGREGGERRFQHPALGPLSFEQLTLRPDQRSDLKLVLLLPPG
jgi:transcriptional regulator with XRE-family HTH domain